MACVGWCELSGTEQVHSGGPAPTTVGGFRRYLDAMPGYPQSCRLPYREIPSPLFSVASCLVARVTCPGGACIAFHLS